VSEHGIDGGLHVAGALGGIGHPAGLQEAIPVFVTGYSAIF